MCVSLIYIEKNWENYTRNMKFAWRQQKLYLKIFFYIISGVEFDSATLRIISVRFHFKILKFWKSDPWFWQKRAGISRVPVICQQRGGYHRKESWKSWGLMSRMIHLMKFSLWYLRSKGSRLTRQEEPPLGSLAVAGHREESASHHLVYGDVVSGANFMISENCPRSL